MILTPKYSFYQGGSTKEFAERGNSDSWKLFRNKYFFTYPKLFPQGTNVKQAYEDMGSIAWATWQDSGDRVFVVYFKETQLREFLNFIFLVYEDNADGITKALCRLDDSDWVDIKHQLCKNSAQIDIPDKEADDTIEQLLSKLDNTFGLALRFPRRYKDDVYIGDFENLSVIFPEEIKPEAPSQPKVTDPPPKKKVPLKKYILLAIMAVVTLILGILNLILHNQHSHLRSQNHYLESEILHLESEILHLKKEIRKHQLKIQESSKSSYNG